MPENSASLISEIKVLLQEELADVRSSIHKIEVEMTRLQGHSISREEFVKAIEAEGRKREVLSDRLAEQDKDLVQLRTTMKIYIAIAAGVAAVIGSGIGKLLFTTWG